MKKKNLLMTAVAIIGFTTITFAQVPNYVPTNGLFGWWPFDGNSNDESANANNGTVNGATFTADRFGAANKAYSFDGVDDYISCNPILGINEVSISIWFKKDGLGGHLVSQNNWINAQSVSFASAYEKISNVFSVGCNNGNCSNPGSQSGTSVPYNLNSDWHHRITTISVNGELNDYLDGQLINSSTITNFQWCTSVSSILKFGAWWNSDIQSWEGKLDDIGIWNRALTECEIQDLYNAQLNSSVSIQAGTDVSICEGNDVIFNGSGGSNYTWNNGVQNGVAYTPTISQEYIVIGQDANNCYGTDTIYIELIPNTTATQTETALDSYTWPINSQTYTQSGNYTAVIPNAAGCDSTITLDLSLDFTGINEFSEDNLFTVFPNPAQSAINIKADNKLIGDVYTIYDNTGRVVLTGKLNSKDTTIELGNLSGGIYMFSVGENMKQTFKVIKE